MSRYAEWAALDAGNIAIGRLEHIEHADRRGDLRERESPTGASLRVENARTREHAENLLKIPHGHPDGLGDADRGGWCAGGQLCEMDNRPQRVLRSL